MNKIRGSHSPEYAITDHAVLRELERVAGIDVAAVRQALYRKVRHALPIGEVDLRLDGFEYRIRDSRLITVVDPGGMPVGENNQPKTRILEKRKPPRNAWRRELETEMDDDAG